MIYTLKNIPISKKPVTFSFPSIEECLLMPFFSNASLEYVRKHGSAFQKEIVDRIEFEGNHKYINFTFFVQYLTPNYHPSIQRFNFRYPKGEWHIDTTGSVFNENDVNHLILSPSEARTEFLKNPVDIEIPEGISPMDFRKYINEQADYYGFEPENAPDSELVTFRNHIHRSIRPSKPEFRCFCRVTETDGVKSTDRIVNKSSVFHGSKALDNVVKEPMMKQEISIKLRG